jgi:hypothetical protein
MESERLMDMLCPKCGEPFENDHFHDVAKEMGSTYTEVTRAFMERGCEAIALKHGPGKARPEVAVLYELLGDDTDGAMSMIEDMGLGYEEVE